MGARLMGVFGYDIIGLSGTTIVVNMLCSYAVTNLLVYMIWSCFYFIYVF